MSDDATCAAVFPKVCCAKRAPSQLVKHSGANSFVLRCVQLQSVHVSFGRSTNATRPLGCLHHFLCLFVFASLTCSNDW